jgi:hypothetical protein
MLTSAFGLWIWARSPSLGSHPECNHVINFVFFGAKIRATSAGARTLGLLFWSSSAAILMVIFMSQIDTLYLAIRALFSRLKALAFKLPRSYGKIIRTKRRMDFDFTFGLSVPHIFERVTRNWNIKSAEMRRPPGKFHGPQIIIPSEILESPIGIHIRRFFVLLAIVSWATVICMTELQLVMGSTDIKADTSLGFGQVSPSVNNYYSICLLCPRFYRLP